MAAQPFDIPPAALEAGARLLCRERHPCWSIVSEIMETDHDGQATEFRNLARAAFLAMVEAWPGMHTHEWQRPWLGGMSGTDLILPLAQKQEKRDDER